MTKVDKNKNVTTFNGTEVLTDTYATFDCKYPLFLLAMNTAGTASGFASAKLKKVLIYDNGTLVRDYVPCIDPEGIAGLYDMVNNVFYADAAGGTFTAGAEIEPETTCELVETKITYTDWREHNLPWLSEINRIRANYNALVRLFLVGLGLPVMAESNYLDYLEVNDWERIAEVGKMMFENMEKQYRYCGMEESGGERLL